MKSALQIAKQTRFQARLSLTLSLCSKTERVAECDLRTMRCSYPVSSWAVKGYYCSGFGFSHPQQKSIFDSRCFLLVITHLGRSNVKPKVFCVAGLLFECWF